MKTGSIIKVALCALATVGQAFYLPGVAPREYARGESINVKADKLTSTRAVLPFSHYSVPFCEPDTIHYKSENLGEILMGSLIQSTTYDIKMKENVSCVFQCSRPLTELDKYRFTIRIDAEYQVNLIIDNLPSMTKFVPKQEGGVATMATPVDAGNDNTFVLPGHPIGMKDRNSETMKPRHILFNHLQLAVYYHEEPDLFKGARVVGFETSPFSIANNHLGHEKCRSDILSKDPDTTEPFIVEDNDMVTFTYEVEEKFP